MLQEGCRQHLGQPRDRESTAREHDQALPLSFIGVTMNPDQGEYRITLPAPVDRGADNLGPFQTSNLRGDVQRIRNRSTYFGASTLEACVDNDTEGLYQLLHRVLEGLLTGRMFILARCGDSYHVDIPGICRWMIYPVRPIIRIDGKAPSDDDEDG
ncbi:hypothetical protein D3C87_1194400 [compost metagenome]